MFDLFQVLSQLRVVLCYAQKLLGFSDAGQLFPDTASLEQIPQDMMLEIQALDRECFYGRCLGFQASIHSYANQGPNVKMSRRVVKSSSGALQ